MKRRNRILTATCLLVLAGAWLFWPFARQHTAAPPSRGVSAATTNAAKTPAVAGAVASSAKKVSTLNTNKLAFRLSNTTNSIRQLQTQPHAILLANALIDTEKVLDLKIPAHLRAAGEPGAYIVQARGVMDARFRALLASAGAQIVSYIPNNAYLVNIPARVAGQLSGNPLVQAVLPYEPYYKLQPSLLGLAVNEQPLPPGTALTLGLFAADAATAEASLEALGAKVIGRDQSPFGPVLRVLAPADWTALVQSPVVQFAEPAFARRAANDLSRVTLGVSVDTLTPTNYLNLYGSNVLVVVNDSGVDTNHPGFSVGGSAAAPGTVPPSRVTGLTYLDMVDTNGHGTHVAGIIAGNGSMSLNPVNVGMYAEGSVSNADFRGKAPLANLFSLNDGGYTDYQLQTNAAMVGALISNNSWDYGNGDQDYDLAAASYDFATRDALPASPGSQPVLFVFAAGNGGGGNDDGTGGTGDTILSPGTAKNVITVGALQQPRNITNLVTTITPGTGTNAPTTNQVAYWEDGTQSYDLVAGYSSRGNVGIGVEGGNGRFKPDVVSPGTFVVSTSSQFNDEWATNIYYNPTNDLQTVYTYQIAPSNGLAYFPPVQVPDIAVAVDITISANNLSPNPFPNLVIYCEQADVPDPVNAPLLIDITSTTGAVAIPPGGGNCTLGNLLGNGFNFAVGNSNNYPVNFNVTVDIYTTNDVDYLSVLEGMNDSLGGYYRYETGTSMAAAAVSGVLALIQDYFTNQFQPALIPSPALMKAVLINGCRSMGGYQLALTNANNFEGWGLENIQNCVPDGGLFNQPDGSTTGSSFFVDQSPTNALATGDSHTYFVNLNTNTYAQGYQLQATLVWTDPPGDPAAAIKLVNNLVLIMTNLDTGDVNYGSVFYGNDISPDVGYNLPSVTNASPNIDTINNVENILLPIGLGGQYSVTVMGRNVNVNAVTAQTNNALGQYAPNIVQDYALVVSVGEGEVTNAFTVTDSGIVSNPTGDQNFTVVITTNAPLVNQMVGASSPLLGTNSLPLGTNTIWGPNGAVTIGQTNQWHFYVVTNTGLAPDYTNAAFLIFDVNTLSLPRMGVYQQDIANATTPEANLDLFVTQDPSITNLNPVAISNCLAGVGNSRAGLANAGTQFAYYTNSVPGQSVYYVGVQSEDQMAAEYDFLPVFTDIPFSSLAPNGDEIVNGLLLPMPTPIGNYAHPGVTNVFALAIMPIVVEHVIVTNLVEHQNFGDLLGELSFGGQKDVLNSHDGLGSTIGHPPIVYDDTPNHPAGTTNSDGPGSLLNYRGLSALGPWILTELDNAGSLTGQVSRLTLVIQPHRNFKFPGAIVDVPPGGWFIDYVDVGAGFTNLTFYATNFPPTVTPPLEMFERLGDDPTLAAYDQEATLTNGNPPGNSISVGPPLAQGRYFIGIYNPSTTDATNVLISYTLGASSVNNIFDYTATSGQELLDDAVTPAPGPDPSIAPVGPSTSGSVIAVPVGVTNLVASVNVGMVIDSPRISDYAFTLVSPTGQRILLMENRGGGDTNGAGTIFVYTNVLNVTATGNAAANTNYLAVSPSGSTVPIIWNFYTAPDQMTVYGTTNPADFSTNLTGPYGPYLLYNTGLTNNPPTVPPGGAQSTIPVTYDLSVPPGISNLTIIMNQFGNPDKGGDAWTYTAGAPNTNYEYLEFTDNTNLATVPIKFAQPPFSFTELSSNYTLSDLNLATNGDYHGPTNIYDAFGGWSVPTNVVTISTIVTNGQFVLVTNAVALTNNFVSVVNDPTTALGGDAGASNYLALAYGTITRSIPTVPGRIYNVTFWYRGPGIEGWWRGEGNANDSSFPEANDNNGALVGIFNFPAGEVDQALEFVDPGNPYQFAGTNAYAQVPASSSLNVAGFTVEGWINPTNLSRPEPLVEWLARVPTNPATADPNLAIVQGPVLDPANGNYYYLTAPTNRQTSELWAEQMGGHLVTMTTANLENWVYDTFTVYGTLNRDLWTGLTYTNATGTFGWSSGYTNLPFTDWAPGQPAQCGANNDQYYVAILGPTNAYPGLWKLEDNLGRTCDAAPTNPIYGVVEVTALPTNGVQFWISGTNWTPGNTNYMQGCLYANIVDTNYGSHQIWSAPGLLTNNVYQHVALTFNPNSGVAALYLNGTNVATSNLFTAGLSLATNFVPKTDGDLLLGWDMSLYTNNFYAGEMDEMSVYGRAMSDAEIWGIYNVSASTTNRTLGKFDPAITPAAGLAEALVTFGSSSNVIFGVNNQWEVNSFTFTATATSMPLTITGTEPGILLDDFAVAEAPLTNLYYFPEQALAALNGTPAAGDWTLQVWDSRAGAFVTNVDQLVNWQLSLVLVSNAVISASLPPQTPVTTTVPSGQIVYYSVTVPAWAQDATNLIVSANLPVSLLFYNPNNYPGNGNPPDATLLTLLPGQTGGVGAPTMAVNPVPPQLQLVPGSTYYLGVQNNNAQSATVALQVDYDLLTLTNGVPFSDVLTNGYSSVRYFAFDVSSNGYEATFQLLQLSGNADLVVSQGAPLPVLNSENYGSFNNGTADQNIYVLTNSAPVPLSAGVWYLGVLNRDGTPIHYSVLAKELDLTNLDLPTSVMPAIINLTNNVPFAWTTGPGAALTNFFHFQATNPVVGGTNMPLSGLRFELYDVTGNGNLTLQSNALPLAPPFFQTSQTPGAGPQQILLFTNSALTNLAADWYLGVPNREITNINYSIVVNILTNQYFPAFPGAESAQGAGAGAAGAGHAGAISSVYHVTTTADSGPGSLRAAVGSANRTVVFDLGGTINLASPLTITNSNLTIAGQTSPGGGITVAGNMTTVTSAHDVIIRDVRFRSAPVSSGLTDDFEGAASGVYAKGQVVKGWTVVTNQTSIVTDGANSYAGHTNFLALANGIISNNLPTVAGQTYTLNLAYRGPGIAGWWRGEGNANSSVYGNNATNVPVLSYPAGEVGDAISLNGSEFLTIPESPSLAVTNVTIEGWINPTTTAYEPLVEYGGAGQYSAIHFWVNGWGLSGIPGMLYANVRPAEPEMYTAGGIVPQNTWTHVAFTMDVNSGVLIIYCNGVQAAIMNMPAPVAPPATGIEPLNLGYRNANSLDTFKGYKYTGGLDEMSVYSRALSPSEIQAIYANGRAGKFDPAVFSSSPAQSLAEAVFCIPGSTTNVFLGNNTNWQTQTIIFTATGATTPLVIRGVEPGMLLDSLSVPASGSLGGNFQFNTVSNVIADHVSTSWGTNADLSVLNSTNVTVQWSIMADSLYSTNGPVGSLLRGGSGTLSFHHNLYADNFSGSPQLGDNLTLDFINNVIYNWGLFSGLSDGTTDLSNFNPNGCTNQLNYVCNYLIAGPDTAFFATTTNYAVTNIAFYGGTTNALVATWIFQTNNFIDSDTNGVLNGANTGWGMFTNDYTRFGDAFPTPPVSVDEAYQAYEKVLDFAGVNQALRDPADTNIVTKVRYQTGRIISSPPNLPGLNSMLPYLDTDQDGLPDFWESTFTPSLLYVPSNNHARTGDGYTDLEEYNNWLAGPHALTTVTNPVAVDLYQMFGESGHLAFYVTNGIQGFVYLTNVLGSVTNTSALWSNTIAVFTPTNAPGSGTNYYGYAAFDCYVTNLDTAAYFGPVTVSVIVSAVPITLNSNFPPVITPLFSGVALDPTNYGGSDYYYVVVGTNDYGALFELDNPTGPMALVITYSNGVATLPTLSSYDYYTNQPPPPANLQIAVLTNSMPVPLQPGIWWIAAVNESGSNVVYTAKVTLLTSILPPEFIYPTNTTVTNILETVPWGVSCVAVDLDTPPLPLSFALVSGPSNLTVSAAGVIAWTPAEAQGDTNYSVAVSVSNGALSVTNTFTINVEVSNLPPVMPVIPRQFVFVPGGELDVTNAGVNPNLPDYPLTYALYTTVPGTDPTKPGIDTNGLITWSPTAADVYASFGFTTVATDTNPPAVNATSLSATNEFAVVVLSTNIGILLPGQPETNVVAPGGVNWFVVPVPTNAVYATNTLLSATLPVNLWYSTNLPPTITNAADAELLFNSTYGVSVLCTNLATAPTNLVPGGFYFLGVVNTNLALVTNALRVDFAYAFGTPLPPGAPATNIVAPNSLNWFTVSVPADAVQASNFLLFATAPVNLWYSTNVPPTITNAADAELLANQTSGLVVLSSNSMPVLLPGASYYLGVQNTNSFAVSNALEVLFAIVPPPPLPPGLPDTNVVAANGLNWFTVNVPTNAIQASNFLLFATAPVNLWYTTNLPPTITATNDAELLTNQTSGLALINAASLPVLLPGGAYYLGVQNTNSFAVTNAVEVGFEFFTPKFSIFSVVAATNPAGSNGFLITWFTATNYQFHLQWTRSLAPARWTNFNGVISDAAAATNGQFQYFDDGSQSGGFGPTRFYRLLLLNSPSNTAPFFLYAPGTFYASPSTPFAFTNTARDWDLPPQTLTYSVTNSLGATNVTVNPGTGLIAWTPTPAQLGASNIITTIVTDNGVPPKSATNSFVVMVPLDFGSITVAANGVTFRWTASTNDQFQIRWTTNLAPANWQVFTGPITSTTTNFSYVDTNTPLLLMKFYQLIFLP